MLYILRPEDIKLGKNPKGEFTVQEVMFLGQEGEVMLTNGKDKIKVLLTRIQGQGFR